MKVREIMSAPVVTVAPDAPVAEVARLMLKENVSGLPVVDSGGRLLGMVTENDLVEKHAQIHLPTYFSILGTFVSVGQRHTDDEVRHVLAVTAKELMTENPATISPDITIDDAASTMVERKANPLPVIEGGELVGIISNTDIIGVLLVEEESPADDSTQS
jgi:CBS domain-containing protein